MGRKYTQECKTEVIRLGERKSVAAASGHYQRNCTMISGDAMLNVPRLKSMTFEMALLPRKA